MAKRGNGEGNIRKRKDGRYEASLMVGYYPDGRRKRVSVYGRTRKACQEKLRALQEGLNKGLDLDENYSFEQEARIWLQNKQRISPATAKNYEHIINTLSAEFVNQKIKTIKPIHIENVMLRLANRRYSQSYISKCYVVLNGVFQKATANGWCAVNSAALAEKITSDVEPVVKEPFTEDEVRLILAADADDKMLHALKLSVGTGIRGQCFLGMEPARHIKEDGSELLIEQAVKMDPNGGSDLPIAPSTYRKYYKATLTKLGLDNSGGPHRLRHTYASIQNRNGVDPVTLSALCGHKRLKTTLEVYTHAMQPALLDAAQKFADAFDEGK